MTLNEMFSQVNANYATVNAIAGSVYNPGRTVIDTYHGKADYYAKLAWSKVSSYTSDIITALSLSTNNIVWTLTSFINEMFYSVQSIRNNIYSIFNEPMAYVVSWIESAIALVESDLRARVDYAEYTVSQSIADMESYLDSEVSALRSELDSMSENMLAWLSEEIAALTLATDNKIAVVTQDIESGIASVNEYITQTSAEIYNHIQLRDEQLMAQIVIVSDTLFDYVNSEVKKIEVTMANILRSVSFKIASEVNRLEQMISVSTLSLTAKIDALAETSLWRYSFFDLFTFRPELSLLRVLLRSETDFEVYKPYWQALFARVLAED